jgi:hypothetical protein
MRPLTIRRVVATIRAFTESMQHDAMSTQRLLILIDDLHASAGRVRLPPVTLCSGPM